MSIENSINNIIRNIVRAYELIRKIIGKNVSDNILIMILKEIEHIAIHELCHGALYTIYPEINIIENKNHVLSECINEIFSRLLETYTSSKIGAYTHSFDEHLHELKHYTLLSKLNIRIEDLNELYNQFIKLIENGNLNKAIEIVIAKCKDWIKC